MIRGFWRWLQRAFDRVVVWPVCKRHAGTVKSARRAFLAHAMNDEAWIGSLGARKVRSVVRKLK